MAVNDPEIIDFVSVDKNGNIVLTISDHLQWDTKKEHLLILQNKLNAYLNAIESGYLEENYPEAKDRSIVINLIMQYYPDNQANTFLNKTREALNLLGYKFLFSNIST